MIKKITLTALCLISMQLFVNAQKVIKLGCSKPCETITKVNDYYESVNAISIYPNPNDGSFKFIVNNSYLGDFSLKIFNSVGIEIYNKNFSKTEQNSLFMIDSDNLAAGLYYASFLLGNKGYFQKLLIIK